MIVRLHKAILAMIGKPNHARVLDGRPEHRVGLQHRNHFVQMAPGKTKGPSFAGKSVSPESAVQKCGRFAGDGRFRIC